VLLGKAPGKFHPVVVYGSGGQYAASIALGDVNGDGRLDVLVGNGIRNGTNNTVGVLLGVGDGTFQAAVSTPVVPFVGQIALADFNHDGRLDIAAGGGSMLLGNGDGTFKPPISLVDSGSGVAVGDFNGDGRPDLAIGNAVSIDVFLNTRPKR
jgi:hypothetical protein